MLSPAVWGGDPGGSCRGARGPRGAAIGPQLHVCDEFVTIGQHASATIRRAPLGRDHVTVGESTRLHPSRLPMLDAHAKDKGSAPPLKRERPTGGRILVVDDEPNIVELVKYNLAQEGYEVVVSYDGRDALE